MTILILTLPSSSPSTTLSEELYQCVFLTPSMEKLITTLLRTEQDTAGEASALFFFFCKYSFTSSFQLLPKPHRKPLPKASPDGCGRQEQIR